ncbi:Ni/Fe-hydrogenase, b-type cytochrome subunit [Heliophilum fasciatum]|uniref:Ni/Fe-hydrogenase 1 B-type cytochrome subunit n=1 Tax=Heliophilum fasciatum TaxID=35700 RepID=A0A4V2SWD9_9FIRM|nr:Ni/Fe-hydrogenase, b-type cytochrome subunit [Heliophilum fasciatum]MCW2278952.1 Ni/Fe-hydrogenase 1 B-type cytochrome subunit [Heliophilum fasciatum]TCP61796.1 Ni/Fe-hydrogenase 1 B-type cytochrome subunit [Heliophilum fasciatum]
MKLFKRVYVWQFPVRMYHWLNALFVMILFVTGIYIGRPELRLSVITMDATTAFIMGKFFTVHMLVGYLFVANFIYRVYWAYAGNQYARSHRWPWQKQYWLDFRDTLLHYLFLKKQEPHYLGHNPLANLAYFFVVILGSGFMAFSGFAMYSELHPDGMTGHLFGWVIQVMGASFYVHMWHRLGAWVFMVFVVIHLYMSLRHELFVRDGTMSSIVSGYKYEAQDKKG